MRPRASRPRRAPVSAPVERLDPNDAVTIGVITKAWGIRGDVAMALDTDFPERLVPGRIVYLDGSPRTIKRSRLTNTAAILQFDGVDDRNIAETLIGKTVAVPESTLPPLGPDTYYFHQILGLTVKDTDGAILGTVKDIWDMPANDVYVVGTPNGDLLIPAIESVVQSVDLAAGVMTVALLPGMEPQPPVDAPSTKPERQRRRGKGPKAVSPPAKEAPPR